MGDLVPYEPRTPLPIPDLKVIINREHQLAGEAALSFAAHAALCGDALIAVKEQLAHGEFMPWVDANVDASYETAKRYMRVARNWSRVTDLPETTLRRARAELSGGSAMEEVPAPTREEVQALFDSRIYYGLPETYPLMYDDIKNTLNHTCPYCQFQWEGECTHEARGQMTFADWCALPTEERAGTTLWDWWAKESDAERETARPLRSQSVDETAFRLLAAGRVVIDAASETTMTATVTGDSGSYVVRVVSGDVRCDCPSRRSRCPHAVAVSLLAGSRLA